MDHILLIDDDPAQLRLRETVLHSSGFTVSVATSPEVALALLESHPLGSGVAVVITDHILRGTTGADLVRAVRRLRPNLPVIALSGMAESEDEYAGLDVVFRQKPCSPAALIALVNRLLRKAA